MFVLLIADLNCNLWSDVSCTVPISLYKTACTFSDNLFICIDMKTPNPQGYSMETMGQKKKTSVVLLTTEEGDVAACRNSNKWSTSPGKTEIDDRNSVLSSNTATSGFSIASEEVCVPRPTVESCNTVSLGLTTLHAGWYGTSNIASNI